MVRDPKTQDELIESSRDTAASPDKRRGGRRSFVFGHTAIANPDIARDIVVRVDEDFERMLDLVEAVTGFVEQKAQGQAAARV